MPNLIRAVPYSELYTGPQSDHDSASRFIYPEDYFTNLTMEKGPDGTFIRPIVNITPKIPGKYYDGNTTSLEDLLIRPVLMSTSRGWRGGSIRFLHSSDYSHDTNPHRQNFYSRFFPKDIADTDGEVLIHPLSYGNREIINKNREQNSRIISAYANVLDFYDKMLPHIKSKLNPRKTPIRGESTLKDVRSYFEGSSPEFIRTEPSPGWIASETAKLGSAIESIHNGEHRIAKAHMITALEKLLPTQHLSVAQGGHLYWSRHSYDVTDHPEKSIWFKVNPTTPYKHFDEASLDDSVTGPTNSGILYLPDRQKTNGILFEYRFNPLAVKKLQHLVKVSVFTNATRKNFIVPLYDDNADPNKISTENFSSLVSQAVDRIGRTRHKSNRVQKRLKYAVGLGPYAYYNPSHGSEDLEQMKGFHIDLGDDPSQLITRFSGS